MKKQIELRLKGLNEIGVQELNEFYKLNMKEFDDFDKFELGDKLGFTKKRIKNYNEFHKSGLDTYIGMFDCKQSLPDGGEGYYFDLKLKHFVHEIYEVDVVETFNKIILQ